MQHMTFITCCTCDEISEFRLFEKIKCKWCEIGTLPMSTIIIGSHMTIAEKCQEVAIVRVWLDGGSQAYPVEWQSVINVLQDVQLWMISRKLWITRPNT